VDLGQQVQNAARPDSVTAVAGGDASRGRPVDIEDITHRYASLVAVDHVSLSIAAGEIAALLGPSGCGKTTLLRVIAGFVRQSAGRVRIDGQLIDHLPANQRNVGIVFQSYALFPHMTVAENVAYGLKARGMAREDVRTTVERFLDVVRLSELRDRLPRQLSGGQQQRVALARALAVGPSVLLLDEPFSALDKSLRLDMQIEIKRLQRQFGLTAILVTHDQDEAMSVADRIAVMNRGHVEQFDTPVAVYDRPASLFVSGFIGTTNLLRGRIIEAASGSATVDLEAGARLSVPSDKPFAAGAAVVLSARPEQLRLLPREAPGCWPVWRRLTVPMGPSAVHDLQARDGTTLKLVEPRLGAMMDGAGEAWCGLRPEARPAIFAATQ
jgi:putative spermidine/putrescine transport system ATP-binding protein